MLTKKGQVICNVMREMNKEIFIALVRIIGVASLGVVYVQLLTLFMEYIHNVTGDLMTNFGKTSFVAAAVFLSCTAVFSFNAYALKGNVRHLGYWCAFFAFVYFYVVNAEGSTLVLLVGIFLSLHSAAAFFLFLLTPILIGEQAIKRITRPFNSDTNNQRGDS